MKPGHGAVLLCYIMTNKFMDFDKLTKHSPVNSENYAVLLSVLIKEFRLGFKIAKKKKNHQFFVLFATSFSININTLRDSF